MIVSVNAVRGRKREGDSMGIRYVVGRTSSTVVKLSLLPLFLSLSPSLSNDRQRIVAQDFQPTSSE